MSGTKHRKGAIEIIMWNLIWKNISRRRNQSILTISITALTIMTFVIIFGVFVTMNQGLKTSADRLGADAMIIPSKANADGYQLLFTGEPSNEYMSIDILEQIKKLEGVNKLSPQFFSQTIDGGCCDFGMEMRVVGFEPETDFILSSNMNIKEYDSFTDEDIILGGDFTDFVGKNSRVLDKLFHVAGELYPSGTGMDKSVFMDIDVARKITLESDKLDVLPDGEDPSKLISAIVIKLDDGVDPERFAKDFNFYSDIDAQCIATSNTIAALQDQLTGTTRIIFVLWVALLVIAILALIGRFSALAKDRKKEIGLMRAIGVQKKQVFGLIIGEACTMALIGGAIGSAVGSLVAKPVLNIVETTFRLPPSVWSLGMVVLSALLGVVLAVVICFFAAFKPAKSSASLEPQTAITQGEVN